jgi:glycine oxidase
MLAALSDEGGDRGPAFQQLCLDSLRLYESILPALEATGIDLRYRRTGVLHLALNDGEQRHLRKRFEAQRGIAPDSRWLEGPAIAAEEPHANPSAAAALLSPTEHYLDPQGLVLAWAEAARRLGARIETGVTPSRFLRRGDRVRGVQLSPAEVREADAVVLAAGAWTAALARRLGAYVPVRPVRGQMLSLQGPKEPLRHVIWGAMAYLVPRENGQTFVGATVEDVGFRKRTTAPALTALRRAAVELVPALREAPVLRAWAGLRPATPDGLPIMGLLPGWSNVWVASGHFRNGILLAPVTGQLLAKSVLDGRPDAALAPFTPLRFAE